MAKRINKIQEFLDEKDIDALLIKSKTVKKWMNTMTGSGCQVLITKEHGYLIVDGRYITEAKEKEHDLEIILHNPHLTGRNYLGTVEEILKKENCKTLGVEAYQVLVKEYQEIEKLGIEVLLLDQEIAHLRIVKEDEEIEAMKKSIAITDEIYQKVIDHIHAGMSEYEISALVQYYSIAAGAQQMSFDTIVATGERTALPHGRPTSRKVKAHEPIMIDFGIQYQNYQSDMTRMCFIGEPDPKIKEIYDVVLKAQLAGLSAIKAGAKGKDVDKAARDVIEDAGYGEYFNEVHNRLGTYCTQWDYIQDRFNKKDLIPFSISDTDFIIPKPITEKIFEVAHHQIYGYTRWNHHDFKSSITGYFERRHHTHIEEDWILYSPTVMYSVSLLIRLLSQPHDKVLTFEPMYDSFYTVIQDNDRQLVAHRLISKDGTFEIDFDLFEKQVQECQLLLLCSPHNPTGRIWTKEEMDQIIKICKKYQVKIISDEIHMDIQLRDRKHIPLLSYIHEYDELYTAASSSKTFNTPGLIGSYLMIPNEEVREKFLMHTRRKDFVNSVSIFGMYATMIGYTQCDDYIDQLNDYIKENMKIVEEFIKEELPDFKFKTPDGTYLAWIDARDVPYTAEEIQDALVNVGGIGIMKGEIYGGPKYLRMNIGCPQSKLKEGLRRFKIAMDALYSK